ncbi:hypothetical protein KKG24_02155 [Patescibacteria group bacterium]|nr:hypothetical protein [Patescibacteria group bacterium]
MNLDLKTEITQIIKVLKNSKKNNLARQIEGNWDKTCLQYSKNLNSYKTAHKLEPIFEQALALEFKRLGHLAVRIKEIIKYLKDHRVIQTTPHLSPAGKPRFFFVNWLASLALEKKDYFNVAMFSGVPFSNKTRPGRLCSKNGDINLIPSNMQDALVYRSKITEKTVSELEKLPPELKELFPEAKLGDSYTKWALKSSEKIESKFLKGKPVFFDFNEVITNYLLLTLKEKDHPIYKILFTKENRKKMSSLFANEIFFYNSVKKGKYEVMEGFSLKGEYLESPSKKILLTPDNLKKEIANGLCAGLPLSFLIITFLNHFKCFGSFAQTEYLPMYKKDFEKIPCLKKYNIKNAPTDNLTTTGGFPSSPNLHPLDLYLGEKLKIKKEMLFGEVIITIKDVLLHQNYSTNMTK